MEELLEYAETRMYAFGEGVTYTLYVGTDGDSPMTPIETDEPEDIIHWLERLEEDRDYVNLEEADYVNDKGAVILQGEIGTGKPATPAGGWLPRSEPDIQVVADSESLAEQAYEDVREATGV